MKTRFAGLVRVLLILAILFSLIVIAGTSASATAQITLFPSSSGVAGNSITVQATNFSAGTQLNARFDGVLLATSPMTVIVPPSGVIYFAVSIPFTTPGVHTISVTDGVNIASQNFNVLPQPKIYIGAPACGTPGTTVTVYGYGFAGGVMVRLDIDGVQGVGWTQTDANGSFTGTFIVPSGLTPGAYTVSALDGAGYSATSTFTVNPIGTYTLVVHHCGDDTSLVTQPGEGTFIYPAGTVVNLVATPDYGSQFISWAGAVADPYSPATYIVMTYNATVYAGFTLFDNTPPCTPIPGTGGCGGGGYYLCPPVRSLTMEVNGCGSVTPGLGTRYIPGSTSIVGISATPCAGWQFAGWTGDVADTNSPTTTVTMNSNKVVAANFTPIPMLADQAAALAKQIIGKDYRTEVGNAFTKGWKDGRFAEPTEIQYLDCSGLAYWSYNKAYGATAYQPWEIVNNKVEFYNPIAFEGAENQYWYNSQPVGKTELRPGDLLFFNTASPGNPDHVAMYVGGPFEFRYGQNQVFMYNTVEATVWGDCIITVSFYDSATGYMTTLRPSTGQTRSLLVNYYGRVIYPVTISLGQARMMGILSKSPVHLTVTDPEGFTVTSDLRETSNMIYLEFDTDNDGELDDVVLVLERKIGEYLITVIPKPGISPTDTFSLVVTSGGETVALANDVQLGDVPVEPYIVRSTETGIEQIVPATTDFDPDTVNLKSKGKWVTAYVELPAGWDVANIDLSTVKLNGAVPAISDPKYDFVSKPSIYITDHDKDGIQERLFKFDANAVKSILSPGNKVEIKITGKVNGIKFEGSDFIKVMKW